MNGFIGLAVIVLVLWCLMSSGKRRPRPVAGHSHAGTRRSTARHEAGHVVAARKVGGRVKSANVYDNGGGLVTWTGVNGTDREQVVANIAFLRAGRYAAGTGAGCGGDDATVRQLLRYLPTTDRAAAKREGEAEARRIVSSSRGEIRRIATHLDKKGSP